MDNTNIKADSIARQDTELKTSITKEAISRDKLITADIQHLPLKRVPESRLAYAADQCLQVVLDRSEEASAAFFKVVEAYMLPACFQPMYNAAYERRGQIRSYVNGTLKYDTRNGNARAWPSLVNYLGVDVADYDNADMRHLCSCINELILKCFNRKQDLDNECPKIVPDPATGEPKHLVNAVSMRALIVALKADIARLDREVRGENGRILVAKELSTRKERRIKSELLNKARQQGLVLVHDSKLYAGAEVFYGCRVNPGSITDYLNELADQDPPIIRDRARISLDLALYDEATGYPRQWRK